MYRLRMCCAELCEDFSKPLSGSLLSSLLGCTGCECADGGKCTMGPQNDGFRKATPGMTILHVHVTPWQIQIAWVCHLEQTMSTISVMDILGVLNFETTQLQFRGLFFFGGDGIFFGGLNSHMISRPLLTMSSRGPPLVRQTVVEWGNP